MHKISDDDPWSLTAALTPGGRHVRLYLETEGKIKTMISEKDNFVKFHSESSPKFFDLSGSPLAPGPQPRDPNIAVNDAGVYALTWDNRPSTPDFGPGGEYDKRATSKTFGLAFSVDGLDWTVYSNEMAVGNLPGYGVRHVVPVFLADDQLRLYFTYAHEQPSGSTSILGCSLGTAISN